MFFLASADAAGQPDVSYMGGAPGFVKALDARTLAFPSYDGNGLFRSLGNLLQNEHVALLFIDFEQPQRLHVLGRAAAADDDTLLACWPGAQLVVRVAVDLVATRRGPAGIAHGLAGMEVEARAATRHTGQLGQDAALGDGHLAVLHVLGVVEDDLPSRPNSLSTTPHTSPSVSLRESGRYFVARGLIRGAPWRL